MDQVSSESTVDVKAEKEDLPPAGLPRDYRPSEPPPLRAYTELMGLYSAGFAAFLFLTSRAGRALPKRVPVADLVLMGVATHRLSRLISQERVTTPIRAPFTVYQGRGSGPNEVREKARGGGLRRAIGQLLTCPFCSGMWAATGLAYSYVVWPRPTRLVASILTIDAISDFLHVGYIIAKRKL